MKLLKGSFLLKVLALASAIVTYFYINNEMKAAMKERTIDPSYRLIKLTAKKLPVKARLATEPPEGYELIENQVTVNPPQIVVIGPEALLDEALSAETGLVDISENTHTVTKKVPLESVAGTHVGGESYMVDVTIPIKKTEPKEPAAPAKPAGKNV